MAGTVFVLILQMTKLRLVNGTMGIKTWVSGSELTLAHAEEGMVPALRGRHGKTNNSPENGLGCREIYSACRGAPRRAL